MDILDIMKGSAGYASGYENTPVAQQRRAKRLCWEYNRTAPDEEEKRREILKQLLGTCGPMTGIEPDFHCDYGFNIHLHGLAVINYNCVILDTSPVHIGGGAFIAPGVCLGLLRPLHRPGAAGAGRGHLRPHHPGGERVDRGQRHSVRRRDHRRRLGHRRGQRGHPRYPRRGHRRRRALPGYSGHHPGGQDRPGRHSVLTGRTKA